VFALEASEAVAEPFVRMLGRRGIIISTSGKKKRKSVLWEEVENRRVALCQVFKVGEGHSEDAIDDLDGGY
jgi:hypothetical protein